MAAARRLVCTVHDLYARAGGRHRASFRNFTSEASHSFGGEYVDLVPNERLTYTDRFDAEALPARCGRP
jgi:uncharacterized protein YndB with AHSA1/START domain